MKTLAWILFALWLVTHAFAKNIGAGPEVSTGIDQWLQQTGLIEPAHPPSRSGGGTRGQRNCVAEFDA